MDRQIKVLLVEDNEGDAILLRERLRDSGLAFTFRRVHTEPDFRRELADFAPELIISDYSMPGFDGSEALKLAQELSPATPFIFVSGTIGEERAIEALKNGASDYVLKDRPLRVVAAIKGALREARDRATLARAEKVREIFGQFAGPDVADLLLSHPEDFWKRGERLDLTVMFADVRGFTSYAHRTEPAEVVRSLNELFGRLVAAIQGEGGTLNKFLGDGLMALFGAPVPLADHALAAARAALKAQEAAEELTRERAARGLEALHLGIGLSSGDAVAGCLGVKERSEYTVIGDSVNVASRLEGVAGRGQILLGPSTAARLEGKCDCRALGLMHLAGLPEPLSAWELRGLRPSS